MNGATTDAIQLTKQQNHATTQLLSNLTLMEQHRDEDITATHTSAKNKSPPSISCGGMFSQSDF